MFVSQRLLDKFIEMKPEDAREILLGDLILLISILHYLLWRKEFTFKPFHVRFINKMKEFLDGRNEKKNLYVGMPPRFGKSQLSVYFLVICYLANIFSNCIYTSYSSGLCDKHSAQVRALLEDPFIQKIFGTRLQAGTKAKDLWKLENGGEFRATPFGGGLTGFAAGVVGPEFGGIIVIDDYMKPQEAWSPTAKGKVCQWFDETLMSRVNNNDRTPIWIIGQRISYDDLAAYVLEKYPEDWDVLIIPAFDEETGEPTWPEKWSRKSCEKRKRQDPYVWAAQYQQKPIKKIEGALFENPSMAGRLEDIKNGTAHIDAGYGGPDTTGLTLFKKQKNGRITMLCKIYTDSVVSHIKGVKALCDEHNIRVIWCETNADKGFLGKEFLREGLAARTYAESQNKFYKISTFLKKYWDDIDFCPESDPKAIQQILEFTETCEHDDCADSAATACRILEKYSVVRADII